MLHLFHSLIVATHTRQAGYSGAAQREIIVSLCSSHLLQLQCKYQVCKLQQAFKRLNSTLSTTCMCDVMDFVTSTLLCDWLQLTSFCIILYMCIIMIMRSTRLAQMLCKSCRLFSGSCNRVCCNLQPCMLYVAACIVVVIGGLNWFYCWFKTDNASINKCQQAVMNSRR